MLLSAQETKELIGWLHSKTSISDSEYVNLIETIDALRTRAEWAEDRLSGLIRSLGNIRAEIESLPNHKEADSHAHRPASCRCGVPGAAGRTLVDPPVTANLVE